MHYSFDGRSNQCHIIAYEFNPFKCLNLISQGVLECTTGVNFGFFLSRTINWKL